MKREIKFRAWDKQDKRMIVHEQDFIPVKITSMGVLRLNPHHVESFWEFMPNERFELMQFTGLKDRNGKEIYEGDVVKYEAWERFHESGNIKNTVVEYNDYGFTPFIYHVVVEDGFYNYEVEEVEVIGNIYENPELLK